MMFAGWVCTHQTTMALSYMSVSTNFLPPTAESRSRLHLYFEVPLFSMMHCKTVKILFGRLY